MYNGFKFLVFGLLLSTQFLACTQKSKELDDPKGRLTEYISVSFSIKGLEDRKTLLTFLTGEAKQRLELWSDEQFLGAFVDSKRQYMKLSFKEVKAVSPDEMAITYELTYLDQSKGKDAKVTNKKLCEMQRLDGKWYIASVKNIKELIEYRNEMALP